MLALRQAHFARWQRRGRMDRNVDWLALALLPMPSTSSAAKVLQVSLKRLLEP